MITPETREISGGDADEEKIRSTETLLKRLRVLCIKKKYSVPARRRRTCCSRTRRRWPWFLILLMKCVVCVCPREKTVREFNSREKDAAENLGCRV